MNNLVTPKGLLIDLDGVLYTGNQPVRGAPEAIESLIDRGFPFRCVSNTTRKCRKTIAGQLSAMGFAIPEELIFTPPRAAIAYMRAAGKDRFRLLATGDVDYDFLDAGVMNPPGRADFVIVGDAGDALTYSSLNAAFRQIMDGTVLIALERDRYWMAYDGLALSAGPFVAALEYATGTQAVVVGKPSRLFFDLALADMGLGPDQVAMIGDDILTDVAGAQAAGMRGILVRTGKFRQESVMTSGVRPDRIIDSVAYLDEITGG